MPSLRPLDPDHHLLHPLHFPSEHEEPLVFASGEGCWLTDTEGRRYLDAFAGLWNVLVGYGRTELAEAAAEQMRALPYASCYAGFSNEPAARLAERLSGYAYPDLKTTFFTCGGAEANETAIKTARFYWKATGKPDKVKVIGRWLGYHGCTMGAMSATGMPAFWKMFEPRAPGFLHIQPPYPYRFEGARAGESVGQAAARLLEEAIQSEGADTVAAFIAEPVIGSGGVIVPPEDHFPLVREICDRHEVLFISDEVITGFGRTGQRFGLNHYQVQPDIMSFAKGVTSGYLPLGGIQINERIREAVMNASPQDRWMHAFTYSGHAACCAVGLKNLEVIETEQLPERAASVGNYLLCKLESLRELPVVGEVRGQGLMAAVELVGDRETKSPANLGPAVSARLRSLGVIARARGDVLMMAPPLVITEAEIDLLIDRLRTAIESVHAE